MADLIKQPWRGFTPPPGFTYQLTAPGIEAQLWLDGVDPTKHRGRKAGHVVRGRLGGREMIMLGKRGWYGWIHYVLVPLDAALPDLDLSPQLALGLKDDFHVEETEFNGRFKVNGADDSVATRAYLSAFLHPRMIVELLSRDPLSMWIRGRYLVTTVVGLEPEGVVKDALRDGEFMAGVVNLIPRSVYARFSTPTLGRSEPGLSGPTASH